MLYPCTHTAPTLEDKRTFTHPPFIPPPFACYQTCFWSQLLAHLTFRSWNIASTVLFSKVCLNVVHYCSINKPLFYDCSFVKESFREALWHHSQDDAARFEKLHPPWVLANYCWNILSWKAPTRIIQFSSWPCTDTLTILLCASLRMLPKGSLIQKINQE